MPRRIALYRGSFNPPGLHHRHIAEQLALSFDEVRVVPWGPCPGRREMGEVPSIFRAALCDITFGDMARVVVDLFALECADFVPGQVLETRFSLEGEVWHVVDADWLKGGGAGLAASHAGWEGGERLWEESRFAILMQPGQEERTDSLPPRYEIIAIERDGSSSLIRELMLQGQDVSSMLVPRARDYIERYGLYRGTNPSTWSVGSLKGLKCLVYSAPGNARAQEWAERLVPLQDEAKPDFVMALGGDGTMLRSIRDHWRSRLPFFGVNAGHVGFLMNAPEQVFDGDLAACQVIFRQLPLLYVEIETANGASLSTYAFNDAWVERVSSSSAWLSIRVNDVPRIEKLVCDGALVATAAGSTAYARAMGAPPLLADTPSWLLVGSNVMEPSNWKSALLSPDSTVEINSLDTENRPVIAYVDGVPQGPVRSVRARLSRAATAEVVFLANRDMAEKIASIQFGR